MGQVWELDLPQNQLSILLAMADHARDDGSSVYPGIDYLAWKTGYSERNITRIIEQLEASGIIAAVSHRNGGRGHVTEWQIDITKGVKKSPFVRDKGCQYVTDKKGDNLSQRVTNETSKGDNLSIKGDKCDTTHYKDRARAEPSLTNKEPLESNASENLKEIVLKVSGKFDDWNFGTFAPNMQTALSKLLSKLERDGRTVADVLEFQKRWPSFINKSPQMCGPPTLNQMLDRFDDVVPKGNAPDKSKPNLAELRARAKNTARQP